MHRLVSIGIAAAGVWIVWMSVSLGVGSLAQPGPGLWPAVIATVMSACALQLAVTESNAGDYEGFTRRTAVVVLAVASLVGYVVAFGAIGYVIPTLAMLVLWLRFIAKESWRLTFVFGGSCTVALYVIFVVVFEVPFPSWPFSAVAG